MSTQQKWRDRLDHELIMFVTVIDNKYVVAQKVWEGYGTSKPWPWRKIHRTWFVFHHVPRAPKVIL